MSRLFFQKPISLLLAVNLIVGLFLFQHYGLSWDEPLFYDYGDALGYAYSPREWFSGQFDVDNSYGASGDDHKTRGPAYLLLARGPVSLARKLSLDPAAAWHLVNFIFFQLGVYLLYRLAMRWVRPPAAVAAAALFAWQPMLWGHAFINPKDIPFLTFFLASICLGFEMTDRLMAPKGAKFSTVFLPAVVLGITTSIRVLGPLAGLLVLLYFAFSAAHRKTLRDTAAIWPFVFVYVVLAVLTMFLTWPYLWEEPLSRFVEVFLLMSDNPTSLSVLFGGEVYRAGELPRRYLPFMLATTLTEPVWLLFLVGVLLGYWKLLRGRTPNKTIDAAALTLLLLWFALPAAYVLIRKPAMYDGIRHFLFILPPIFLFSGFAFEHISERINSRWLYAGLVGVFLLSGIISIARLHPYEYTYYNSYIGGAPGTFRSYETDYWLTCYKEAVDVLNETVDQPANLFVHREAYIAEYYAGAFLSVRDLRGAVSDVESGDYILVNTRTNEDRRVFREASPVIQIERQGALFCTIKRVP